MNVDLGKDPPALDNNGELSSLQSQTTQILRSADCQSTIEKVAHRLVASTFYFVKDERLGFDEKTQMWNCTGMVPGAPWSLHGMLIGLRENNMPV